MRQGGMCKSPAAKYRVDCLACFLLILAGLAQPLLARLLGKYNDTLAITVPTILIVVFVCLLRPRTWLPPLALLAIILVDLALLLSWGRSWGPSVLERLMDGKWRLLGIPVVALALGYAAVLGRRRLPLWRWPVKSNIRLLSRRPGLFVRIYKWPLVVLIIGSVLDAVTTSRMLGRYGPEAEIHPAGQVFVEVFGASLPAALVAKFIQMAFAIFVAALWRKWCGWILFICGVLYTLAAASNHFGWL